jgi:hypothetical protein
MSHQRPHICAWEVRWGAVSGYMTAVDSIFVDRFDQKLAAQGG